MIGVLGYGATDSPQYLGTKKGACVNQLCRSFVSSVMSRCFVRMINILEYICMVRVVLRFIYIYIYVVYIYVYILG